MSRSRKSVSTLEHQLVSILNQLTRRDEPRSVVSQASRRNRESLPPDPRRNAQRRSSLTRIRTRTKNLIKWTGVRLPKRDCTLPVDLADLRMKCSDIARLVDQLASTA